MREEIINKTDDFVARELMKLAGFKDNIPRMAEYRIEHSRRVAHIADADNTHRAENVGG